MGIFSRPSVDIRTRAGYTRLYETYAAFVFNICFDYLEDEIISENLTADIFVSLWDRRDQLYQRSINKKMEWTHYLSKAAKNKAIDHIRSVESAKQYKVAYLRDFPLYENTTDSDVDYEELANQIASAVNKLPEKCQQIFRLSREDGLSKKEIASQLNISVDAVKRQITIALNKLRDHLPEYNIPKRYMNK